MNTKKLGSREVERVKVKTKKEEGKKEGKTICPKLKTSWKWLKDKNLRFKEITLDQRNEHDLQQSDGFLSLSIVCGKCCLEIR